MGLRRDSCTECEVAFLMAHCDKQSPRCVSNASINTRDHPMRYDITIVIAFTAIALLGCNKTSDHAAQADSPIQQRDGSASNRNEEPAAEPTNSTPALDPPDGKDALSAAELFAAGMYSDALAAYRKRLKQEPANQTLLYNAGQCAYLTDRYDEAAKWWLVLEELTGDKDLGVKEKLIQTHEKLDEPDEVARRIAELAGLRKETDDLKYKQKKSFCRDQFTVGDDRFIIHHHFDFPIDDESQFIAYCAGSDGKTKYWFRLWSSKTTNAVAREIGALKNGERLFHIDEYDSSGSKINHLHTKQSLPYRDFKEFVTDLLNERRR